jgi:hypothetical protein
LATGPHRDDRIVVEEWVEGLAVYDIDDEGFCEDCLSGKQTRWPFDGIYEPEKEAGENGYMDLWGPAQVTGTGNKNWLFHLLDGHVMGAHVDFLMHKSADKTFVVFNVYIQVRV